MRMIRHRRLTTGACVLGGALAVGVTALASVASPASGAPLIAPAGAVSATPASGTPALKPTTGNENIRQIVQCGSTMYAVGNFSQITWNGQTFARNNAFSFSANAPYTMTSWNPDTNGIVDSIAVNSSCTDAYIGGAFNTYFPSEATCQYITGQGELDRRENIGFRCALSLAQLRPLP